MKTVERNLFPKNERLCLQKNIDRLFATGKSFISYPLRIIYLSAPENNASESGISVLVSVPKKRIRQAVARNRIKRLIRESYRLNKNDVSSACKQNGEPLHLAFLYLGNDVKKYYDMQTAMQSALETIKARLRSREMHHGKK